MAGPVHYEVFIRKTAPAPWALLMATENRSHAIETAEDILNDNRAAAVRVTKETLDAETMEFSSLTVLTRGAPEIRQKRVIPDDQVGPRCTGIQDFYAPHARDLIGRVLEDWLIRRGVTPFELLHRPDLAEVLEASGVELQHAVQKVAVPESSTVGQPVHELIRHYQKLADAAIERLVAAGRAHRFPTLEGRSLADLAHRLAGTSDRAFIMGGVVSGEMKGLKTPRTRLDRLMDLAEAAPMDGPPRAIVMVAIEQILCEMMAQRTSLADILGPSLDQGASLAAVVRMVAPAEIEALIAQDHRLRLLVPMIEGPARRLGERLQAGEFPLLSAVLARMVLRELRSPRRLRPADPEGEIDILRALAMTLTATAGRLLTLEEVQDAFTERSKSLITADFVAAFVKPCQTVMCEAEHLMRLCENVTGAANKRSAARWLHACLSSLRFETEMRRSELPPGQVLATLAGLQRAAGNVELAASDEDQICEALGKVGASVESSARLIDQMVRAPVPVPHKLQVLLRLAAGETGPRGPVTERARAEALKLLRHPKVRAELGSTPAALEPIRELMRTVGLAA